MKQEVKINLKSAQKVFSVSDSYEMDLYGIFEGTDTDYEIRYQEHNEDGTLNHVTVKVRNNAEVVTVIRLGAAVTEMMLEPGVRHTCRYHTPFGEMMLSFTAKKLSSEIENGQGSLSLRYTIDSYGEHASDNQLVLRLQPRRARAEALPADPA